MFLVNCVFGKLVQMILCLLVFPLPCGCIYRFAMVVVVGDVTIGHTLNKKDTCSMLAIWAKETFPSNKGLPGSDAIRLGWHSTFHYFGRGVPNERFMAIFEAENVGQHDFHGTVKSLIAVGDENKGLVIMVFDCESMQLAANKFYHAVCAGMDKPPKQMLLQDDENCRHGFCPHVTVAAFDSKQDAQHALDIMSNYDTQWFALFKGNHVRLDGYKAIE